jgi:Holliday junction resolvase-like predicted endonuclease
MTDQELKDFVKNLAVESDKLRQSQAKTDVQMAKTDSIVKETSEQIKKTDESLKRIGKMVGGISNNQGDIAEEFFYNSLADKPTLGGIKYDFIDKNVTRRKGKIVDEYDILLVNGKDVAIIEVKYKAHEKDLERLLNKKYTNFKKLYPEYTNYNHHLAIASFYIDEDLKDNALDSHISVLQRKGDVIETTITKARL